jgi:hypothetical protein
MHVHLSVIFPHFVIYYNACKALCDDEELEGTVCFCKELMVHW